LTGGTLASAGTTFANLADHGTLLLAIPVALIAGLVSFLSPCVLPLVPGYLSFVTGLSGTELAGEVEDVRAAEAGSGGGTVVTQPHRGRIFAGSLLFVIGFTLVFVLYGVLFGAASGAASSLLRNQGTIIRVLGVFTIAMGLVFMGALGWLPGVNRDVRVHRIPQAGLAGAPLLGIAFGFGWTPCLGPTAGAVLTLMGTSGSAGRGVLLGVAYGLGLGLPFIAVGVAFKRAASAMAAVKRHYALVSRVGGGFLVLLGLLQVSGAWEWFALWMRTRYAGVSGPI
jgi:cytochrome c-type biogenesis protein